MPCADPTRLTVAASTPAKCSHWQTLELLGLVCLAAIRESRCTDLPGLAVADFSPSAVLSGSRMLNATCRSSLKFSDLKLPCSSLICKNMEMPMIQGCSCNRNGSQFCSSLLAARHHSLLHFSALELPCASLFCKHMIENLGHRC